MSVVLPKSGSPVLQSPEPKGSEVQIAIPQRRQIVAGVTAAVSTIGILFLILILSSGGWTTGDTIILVAALLILPPLVLDALNAAIGFYVLRIAKGGLSSVAPHYAAVENNPAITAKTAILLTLRNNPVDDAIRRFKLIRASVENTGEAGHFSFFILSDTSDPVLARREEELVREWNKTLPDYAPVNYRRRLVNAGYKAGNLADFCRNWGDTFDFVIPLDVSSFMTGPAILELVRVMQANPKIGIVQSLAVYSPIRSAFARISAFSERCQTRVRAIGAAWWQADCAIYEGRNAILRIAPFYLHCRMPHLEGRTAFSGAVIRHELVEAAMMQRAGYEVRSLPVETGSYVDGPSSLFQRVKGLAAIEQGALQLTRFIGLERISPLYRIALALRAVEAIAPVFFMAAIFFASLKAFENYTAVALPALGVKLVYTTFLLVMMMPRLFGFLDALMSNERVKSFGGYGRLAASSALELLVAFLLQPVLIFRASFALLRTPFVRFDQGPLIVEGRKSDMRSSALKSFWPVSLYGFDLMVFLLLGSSDFALWSMPMTLGFALAVPVAALLSSQYLYGLINRAGLFGVPELFNPPREIVQFVGRPPDADLNRAA